MLYNHTQITYLWNKSKMDEPAALELTILQVNEFRKLINDDDGWEQVLTAFNNGRDSDAWLAADWPAGFDELLLCVPLCKLVDFECSKCHVGKRQFNNSCAHDDSLFGYVAEIIKTKDRAKLNRHLDAIDKILNNREQWNMLTKTAEEI